MRVLTKANRLGNFSTSIIFYIKWLVLIYLYKISITELCSLFLRLACPNLHRILNIFDKAGWVFARRKRVVSREVGLDVGKLEFPEQRMWYLVIIKSCYSKFSHSNKMTNVMKLMSRERNLLNYGRNFLSENSGEWAEIKGYSYIWPPKPEKKTDVGVWPIDTRKLIIWIQTKTKHFIFIGKGNSSIDHLIKFRIVYLELTMLTWINLWTQDLPVTYLKLS